jgi:ASC-1-like (ASCH) protein
MENQKDKYYKYKMKYLKLKHSNMTGGALHNMDLNEPWFSLVKNGTKTIEGRIYDDKRRIIQIGDTITFSNKKGQGELFSKVVVDLAIWDNFNKSSSKTKFKDVIDWTNYKQLIPVANSPEEAIKVYENIPEYTDKAKENGIIFIYLE